MADPVIEQFRAANAGLSKLVRDELAGFFGTLDLAKPEAVRDALLEFVPLLVSEYGPVAESLALDYYEEMRAASGASGAFRAMAGAGGIPTGAVESKVRYLAGQLWTPDPASMLGGLLSAVDKYVKQPGRDAVSYNAKREGVAWARVPTGAKTCAFCLVLASRDAVFHSKQSAGDRRGTGKGDAFHGDCDCSVVRISKASDYPKGYLPDNYYDMYTSATDDNSPEVAAFLESLPPGDKNKQLKAAVFSMRRNFPNAVKDGVHTH
ncbi:hypothetical protein E5206_09435 [Arthrobacter sp. PAMC25564]|uniref:VG15 protein n=1 Tax=Arthrobacter sp. PAMC25564 TaxID=2565366 RepID=UPI0010A26297|nr:hypothetical protein [Arthrobacter sp. PAMC25564]QCB97126.1 hypothetical protein E5206_09435 [Arthrobacter sp. PAMC25564]